MIVKRFTTDLMSNFVQSMKYSVGANIIKFFDLWFVDLRDFAFFLKSYISSDPKFNIRIQSFDFSGTAVFAAKYAENPIYGYFSVDWSQAEIESTHVWVANTLTGILSNLGGYSTVLTTFFGVLLTNYQRFVFDKSMLKKMYF